MRCLGDVVLHWNYHCYISKGCANSDTTLVNPKSLSYLISGETCHIQGMIHYRRDLDIIFPSLFY